MSLKKKITNEIRVHQSIICMNVRYQINWRANLLVTFLRIGMAVCKSADESVVEDSYCDANSRPSVKSLMPCNTHPCTTKWVLSSRLNCLHGRTACTFYVKETSGHLRVQLRSKYYRCVVPRTARTISPGKQ